MKAIQIPTKWVRWGALDWPSLSFKIIESFLSLLSPAFILLASHISAHSGSSHIAFSETAHFRAYIFFAIFYFAAADVRNVFKLFRLFSLQQSMSWRSLKRRWKLRPGGVVDSIFGIASCIYGTLFYRHPDEQREGGGRLWAVNAGGDPMEYLRRGPAKRGFGSWYSFKTWKNKSESETFENLRQYAATTESIIIEPL